ncbi:MAG: hypothetical protein GY711_09865 [bacterium]|nr:hypothetical protein [bacterium]
MTDVPAISVRGVPRSSTLHEPQAESFEVLAENELDERTNSTPAIVDGEIFLRTHESLYCIAATD